MKRLLLWVSCLLGFSPVLALAEPGLAALKIEPGADGSETYTVTIQVLMFMTALSLLPAALMMMTSFTRIIIVLAIVRQALGTQSSPSNQVLIGLALFLSLFVMMPVFDQVYEEALSPYMEEQMTAQEALQNAAVPFRGFMLGQTRDDDLMLFANISNAPEFETAEDVPFSLLMPAFVTSELKTAFQIGFLILIPFLVIDLVIATLLMSMGMMMLSPMIISLPFKIMLFVLIDGWSLIMGTLAASFAVLERNRMTPETVLEIGVQTMTVTGLLAAPLLLSALVVGLLIGMFQAATQINEMTLTFVPKLIVVALVIMIAGPALLNTLLDFTTQIIGRIPDTIG